MYLKKQTNIYPRSNKAFGFVSFTCIAVCLSQYFVSRNKDRIASICETKQQRINNLNQLWKRGTWNSC